MSRLFTRFFFLILMTNFLSADAQNTLDNAGLGATTQASVAFSLRKLSSTYNGFAIKVRRASDNAEANVSFDGSGAVSNSSTVLFTPGVTVNASLGTAQAGTITTATAKTGTISVKVLRSGSISTSMSSTAVTGFGTSFTTELAVGDRLYSSSNVFLGIVASISNNTSLSLSNYATVAVSLSGFRTSFATVSGTSTNFTGELAAGDRIFTSQNIYLGTVAAITNATTMTLQGADAVAATLISYRSTGSTVTGIGTSFGSLSPGDLLISNNITVGTIASIGSATTLTLTTRAGAAISSASYKTTPGTVPFSTFYSGTSVFINTWYDQSGNSRDAVQLKSTNQARLVNAGTLYIVNARPSLEFSASLTSFLQTSTTASYLNNALYTLNKVTAESTTTPNLQLPMSTTGGSGPSNTISHYGYRSSSQFTVAQYGNDQNFAATPSTTLEVHTAVKATTGSSTFYKNGISLGTLTSGSPSNLSNVGLLNIGYYTPTTSYYSGSVSELMVFGTPLMAADVVALNTNQQNYYNIASTYWTGAVNTDWNNSGNWSTGILPTISEPAIVVIPAGKPNYPLVSGVSIANSITIEAGASLTVTGTMQVAGTINNAGTCTASNGTLQYLGTAPQNIQANTFAGNAIRNIIVNNATGVSLSGNLSVTGNINFTSGTFAISGTTLTIGGTVTNTVSGGFSGNSTGSIVITGTGNPVLSFDQSSPGTSNALKSLSINATGAGASLGSNLVMTAGGTLAFTAGKLSIGANTLTVRGSVVNTVSGGLKGGASSNLVVDGAISPTLSMDMTTPGTTNALGSLTLNAAGQTVTMASPLTVMSNLNVSAGTFADAGNQVTSTGTVNLTGSIRLGSASVATSWPGFTTNTINTGGTVEYASGVAQTVSSIPVYQNLVISATGGGNANGNLTVNGALTLSAANPSTTKGTLSTGGFTLNMGSAAITSGQGDVTGFIRRTTILPNVAYTMGNEFTSITFPTGGTLPSQIGMKVSIGVTPSWQPGAIKRVYDFTQTGGTGTKAVINAHYLDAELNGNTETKLVDFSYHFSGALLTEHGKSSFNTTQNYVTLSNVNVAFFASSFGAVELSLDESTLTTLTWNGSTSTSWITATNWTPNGGPSTNTTLIIPDAGTTPNDPSLPATASNGTIIIEPGGILNADPGAQLSLNNTGLAWSNNGTFNPSTSTITFTDANATMDGSTSFNNVTIAGGAGLLLSTGTTMRIGGTMTNNGTWRTGIFPNTVEYNGANQTVVTPNGSTAAYYNLMISGTGTTSLPAGNLNIMGDLTLNGAVSATGSTIAMGGSGAQSINGSAALALNNLVINNTGAGIGLGQHLSLSGLLTFNAGNLSIGSHTLTLSGGVTNNVSNGLTGSSGSNIVISGGVTALSFDQRNPGSSNVLNNLTINNAGQTANLASAVSIEGTLTFTAGKLAINSNTLSISGNIVNTVSGGLVGGASSSLNITGGISSPTLSMDAASPGVSNQLQNLALNSSGQTITLNGGVVIGGTLELASGLINTTAGNMLTLLSSAVSSGGSDASFVNGPLTVQTAGTASYSLPVGKANTYRPVSIAPVTASAGVYVGEYFPAAPATAATSSMLTGIATDEYWNVTRTSGPDGQVTLPYHGANSWAPGSPSTMDNIVVATLNAGVWEPVFGSTLAGNQVNSQTDLSTRTLSSFSSFTFGFGNASVLPVTLSGFTGKMTTDGAQLHWTGLVEQSLDRYEVQRSANGVDFATLGKAEAKNNGGPASYSFTDVSPLQGTNYYRLKAVDIDGKFTYSKTILLTSSAARSISVYPNPVEDGVIQLHLQGMPAGRYVLDLLSTNGGAVNHAEIASAGYGTVTIPAAHQLTRGIYFLRIAGPDKMVVILKILTQ